MTFIIPEENYLEHYGTPRHSGRYPWGSGGDENTRNRDFLAYVDKLKADGLSETEIARGLGSTTSELRRARSIAKTQQRQESIRMAQRLHDKGLSNVAIGERMGINESSVRALLAPGQQQKADILQTTANMLKDQVEQKNYIDVGTGVELHLGVSKDKLATAVAMLEDEGYKKHYVKITQLGTGEQTTLKVLTKPGVPYSEVYKNRDKITLPTDYSIDGGLTFLNIKPPLSISSKRVGIRYAEQGGTDADGVIYVRPGVPDVSLGSARYAQVRVAVDGSHYLKGMAMYKDDLPEGVDLVFNTNKKNTGNKLDAMKEMKKDEEGNVDKDNPFGASISRQLLTHDGSKPTSVMNIVNEEGNWEAWSKSLSSQFLSKQSPTLAKTQLDMTHERARNNLDDIMKLQNPSVRKKLLESFADSADAASVHLKAAALPRQRSHVILPINSLKDTEVYAPNYNNGERVVLVRFPHGGIFEIPELVVNNRHPEAKKLLGNVRDAIGINSKVAERLSGADFDGDTVLVIPNNNRKVKNAPPLKGLIGFDPKSYKDETLPKMKPKTKGLQMGDVSNLITDMTIKGATDDELARAVRHSMVVIDAEKHSLDYKKSAIDNGIRQLKEKYQGGPRAGAATIVSRRKSTMEVPERKQGFRVDPNTGKKIYTETGATTIDRKGNVVPRTSVVRKLAETDDAHTLSSGYVVEKVYADHSNRMKALANEARKAAANTKSIRYSPSARTAYAKEVASLDSKLALALRNAPLERISQVIGNATYSQKLAANPDMEASEKKKIKGQALAAARARTGAGKERIEITDAEWDAIQAGAISPSKLDKILNNADLDRVQELATPKSKVLMTPVKTARARQMEASGYTQAEIAEALGVSLTTLKNSLNG